MESPTAIHPPTVIPSERSGVEGPAFYRILAANNRWYSGQTTIPCSPLHAIVACPNWACVEMYKAVRTSRLYEQIVHQIEESILKGSLKPGDQLPSERELAQRFGVSRTAVREAVKALREKGLVEAYSGRGTFITNGTSQAMRQSLDWMSKVGQQDGLPYLVEMRAILEPEIAALAATRIDEQHLAAMHDAFHVMERSREDPVAFIEADLDFHLSLRGSCESSDSVINRFHCWPSPRTADAHLLCRRRSRARTISP